jgi:hypothetical protein
MDHLGIFGRAREAQWISCSLGTGELKKKMGANRRAQRTQLLLFRSSVSVS